MKSIRKYGHTIRGYATNYFNEREDYVENECYTNRLGAMVVIMVIVGMGVIVIHALIVFIL